MQRKISIILSILVAIAVCNGNPSFRHYNTDHGLPANTVRDILQDSIGFMWFATDGGLARFDGKRFKVFPLRENSSELSSPFVGKLRFAGGKIWASSDNRLLCFDPVTETLSEAHPIYAPGEKRRISSTIRDIASDSDGNLWIACTHEGVFRLNTATLETSHYDIPELSNNAGSILVDADNNVWLANNQGNGTLLKLNRALDLFKPFRVTVDGHPFPVHSMAMNEDKSRMIWIGTWNDGLLKMDPYTGQAEKVLSASAGNRLLRIHSICVLPDGSLLIGSDTGLSSFNPATAKSSLYLPNELDPTSISDKFVYPVVNDREGGIWVGTFYGGINYIAPPLKQFSTYRHSRFVNSVSGDIISGFCEDSNGNIWIASDDGGLTCMNKDGTFTRHYLRNDDNDVSPENIHTICADGDNLWIGTYSSGVWLYNPTTGAARRFREGLAGDGNLNDSSSYAIFRDNRGNIWVATTTAIFTYDKSTDSFENVRNLDVLTIDIDQDSNGNLWFSTQGKGLFRFDPYHGVWKNFRTDSSTGPLPSNFVNSIHIDSSGRIWAATDRGLALYDAATDGFSTVSLGEDARKVFWVGENDSALWLTTDNGIICYRPNDSQIDSFTAEDGLTSSQFAPNAGLRSSDGRIFVGSSHGFNTFFPRQINPNTTLPAVAFTDLLIVNSPIAVGDKRLPEALNYTDGLHLSHNDYQFSIEFAALSFANPGQNQYAYMLEGFDKDWIDAGTENRATYSNLSPGDYTLRVRASNNDRMWANTELRLPIHVSPPWYSSWPMKALYFILVMMAIAGAFWYMRRYYDRRQAREIERMHTASERNIFQAKLSFFTMIAHEIRTPVSLIIGPLEQIMRHPDSLSREQMADLDVINRNSRRLLDLVNQLLDFKKVEQEGLLTDMQTADLTAVLRNVTDRFTPSFKHQNITFTVALPNRPVMAFIDPETITKMVSNLLANARKFARSAVEISMTEPDSDGNVLITVSDDGCGIPDKDKLKIFNPFYQVDSPAHRDHGGTGIGLSIVKTAVDAHKGRISIDTSAGGGAAFVVTLPIGHPAPGEATTTPELPQMSEDTPIPATAVSDHRQCLLVVDDNPDMLSFISSNFSGTYRVETAADGKEALGVLQSTPVDFIISDWMMPGMSGVDLCRAVRNDPSFSHIPFILLTAKTDDYSKITGLNCGADAYVSKPFSVAILEARINGLLNIRSILRKKFSSSPLEPIATVASNPTDTEFLDRLTAEIEANFASPNLSVDMLSEAMGVSRSSLYAKIKSLVDATPNELIQITRLKKAASLLATGRYRINEVSYMVGFNSSSYFTKCFQKQFGIKPTDFLARNGGENGKSTESKPEDDD